MQGRLSASSILWANDDLPDLTPPIAAETILDGMARPGFEGSQLGSTFPKGEALIEALRGRCLQIAEDYAGISCTVDGPAADALARGRTSLAALHEAQGDVLVTAAAEPLRRLRAGEIGGFLDGLRERIFSEVGAAVVDVSGVLGVLAERDHRGWIMTEQDATRRPPSESAAIARAVFDCAVRQFPGGLR